MTSSGSLATFVVAATIFVVVPGPERIGGTGGLVMIGLGLRLAVAHRRD